jgi:hypothetical protein
MERLIPPRKDLAVRFKLRPTTTAAEVAAAVDAILQDVARGQLTPAEGHQIIASFESRLKIIQAVDHEGRMSVLESGSDETTDPHLVFLEDPEVDPQVTS